MYAASIERDSTKAERCQGRCPFCTYRRPVAVAQTISISINGGIDPAIAASPISNQATLRFDADGNGSNEATALSDDPSQPGPADATVVGIGEVVQVPTLDRLGLLLALSGGLLLRRRA